MSQQRGLAQGARGEGRHSIRPALLLGVAAVLAFAALAISPPFAGASRLQAEGPVSCRVGIDVLTLHHFDMDNETFDATFWLWSVCPTDEIKPLDTLDFVNADDVQLSLQSESFVDGAYQSFVKVSGTFRHAWDAKDYPFDRQYLQIQFEDVSWNSTDLVYEADVARSAYGPESLQMGWQLNAFTVASDVHTYRTAFGQPVEPGGANAHSRYTVTFALERDDSIGFIKLVIVIYIAFLVSVIASSINMYNPALITARMTVMSGALFAVAVNLHMVTTTLGSDHGITLVDKIHVAALVAILFNAIAALLTQVMIARGRPPESVARIDRLVMALVVVAFVGTNVWLIGQQLA